MSDTGRPSIHIASDSTIAFRDETKENKSSLLPEFRLREHVFGSSQNIMSGALASAIQETASSFNWSKRADFRKGIHIPMRFIFRNFNDIVDETKELNGVGADPRRKENPIAFAGSLRMLVEAAIKLVDDAMTRAADRAIEIMYVGGDHKCWQTGIWHKPDVG
eukprot:8154049-Pyramimonas_sp.AAC.2